MDKKIWHIYTLIEYYSAVKKNEMSFAGNWIELEVVTLSYTKSRKKKAMKIERGLLERDKGKEGG
jgi:hypothetical protein